MPMVLFHDLFPELAAQETRTFTVTDSDNVPDGDYGLLELYCDEVGCDCRRVVLEVISVPPDNRIWATITFGWETEQYYAGLLGDAAAVADAIADAKGPVLEPFGEQCQYSSAVLEIVKGELSDQAYVQSLQRHYTLFREAVAATPASG